MDPQLDVNALIRLLGGVPEFVAFAQAQQAVGLSYNEAARAEFLANGLGTQADLDILERGYGVVLITDVSAAEIDAAAQRLQSAFRGDPLGRVLHLPDARVLATALLKTETIATGDLQLFKRAKDLGLSAAFIGRGRAAARAATYVPQPVVVPGGP
jgi:predicted nucleic acid-binding protein